MEKYKPRTQSCEHLHFVLSCGTFFYGFGMEMIDFGETSNLKSDRL